MRGIVASETRENTTSEHRTASIVTKITSPGLVVHDKGWLNIGGVKILLWKYTEPLSRANPVITGAVLLETKSDKTVTSLEVKVIEEVNEEEEDGDKK